MDNTAREMLLLETLKLINDLNAEYEISNLNGQEVFDIRFPDRETVSFFNLDSAAHFLNGYQCAKKHYSPAKTEMGFKK